MRATGKAIRLRFQLSCPAGEPLFLAGCGREPGWFPVPAQQSFDLGTDPGGIGPAVKMGDADANDYIIRDIGRAPGVWRWAYRNPELRFRVTEPAGLHFIAEIAISATTFHSTGPVTVSYFIGGRRLGSIRCNHTGKYEIDQPVPPGWMKPGSYVHVSFDADRYWVSPDDRAQLSFLLFKAGFRK